MKKRTKNMTLDNLAIMVAKGFEETATKKDIADMATKQDIKELKKELKKDISGLDERLSRVEMKLDRALFKEIDRLEGLIRQLAKKVNVKLEF